MNKQQNRLDQRQAKIYLNFNASLREMFNRMNPADAPYQFPPPPPLFVYPPADLAPEDDANTEEADDADKE